MLYVYFFIELGSRRTQFAGRTEHLNAAWVNQQERQVVWDLEGCTPAIHFLIHDYDSKFTETFHMIFPCEHIHVIPTSVRSPNANAFAERWVKTVRNECLDKLRIFNEAHLRRVLREYIANYNAARPHQALAQ